MGDKISISLEARTVHGKKVAKLRKDGLTPVVVYGPGMDPVAAQAADGELSRLAVRAGKHTPVHLSIEGKKKIAMIKSLDFDPVKNTLRHVSFHAVKANEPVDAEVPIRLVGEGESEAEKSGLIILQNIESIEVKALPMDLPEALELDITGLKEAGDKLTIGDITLPEKVELVGHDSGHHEVDDEDEQPSMSDLQVVSVWEPSALAAQNEAAGGDAEDESEVESENGGDTDQDSQAEETRPGGKGQDEPKQSNVDANK